MSSDNSPQYQETFSVDGMTCASCVRIVERQLKKIDGISYVSVNLATEKAMVLSDKPIDIEGLKEKIAETGYSYKAESPTEDLLLTRFRLARKNLTRALAVTLPLTVLMILHMSQVTIPGFIFMELVGGAYVLAVPGRRVLNGAYIAVTHKHTNMDTLVSIGAVLSWLTVPLVLLGMPIASFGSLSSMLIAFHLTGRYIESRLKYRASTDIRQLLSAQSTTANLVIEHSDGSSDVQRVSVETVKEDALLLVRTGERIPLDGIVQTGAGYVDASMVTGEPIPVPVREETEVVGGTILTSGSIYMKVTHVGDDTFLSRMIKLVEDAQSSQVPIQALADQVTKVFIPIVFSIAILSAASWALFYSQLYPYLNTMSELFPWISTEGGAISTAASVFISILVIACPCALGLATPMALVAGSGTAARQGMIIKDGEAIQGAKDLQIILLDKTGTITLGHPEVVHTTLNRAQLTAVAAIETHSTHPLALSIQNYVKQTLGTATLPEAADVKETAGEGMSGTVDALLYRVGRPRETTPEMTAYMEQGATIIEVTVNEQTAGFIAITDPVKADSAQAVELLLRQGITPVMVTGDQQKTAESTAAQVGITTVHANLHPEDKLEILRSYQKEGYSVAMVGDGINDAAVLKAADVGIALGTGTDLSIESAGIIIVSGALTKIIDIIAISKRTFRTIRQNLFWAFLYNIIALPIAAAGILHPAMAEIAMTFSSINVILNSMRIRTYDAVSEQSDQKRRD